MSEPTTDPAVEPTNQPVEPLADPTKAAEPTKAPEDWRQLLDEGLRNDPNISKFKDPNALAQSYISASKMIGKDKVPIPGEHATDDDWKAFYKAGGMPDDPEGYAFKAPEELPEGVYSEDMAKWFKQEAHKAGLNPKQAQQLHDSWATHIGGQTAAQLQELEQGRQTAEAELRKEWGAAFDQRMMAAKHIVQELGGDEFANFLVESKLGNDPRLAKFMAKVASMTKGESGLVGSFDVQTPADIDAEIAQYRQANDKVLRDAMHPDHKRMVQGLTRLYEKKHAA